MSFAKDGRRGFGPEPGLRENVGQSSCCLSERTRSDLNDSIDVNGLERSVPVCGVLLQAAPSVIRYYAVPTNQAGHASGATLC